MINQKIQNYKLINVCKQGFIEGLLVLCMPSLRFDLQFVRETNCRQNKQ